MTFKLEDLIHILFVTCIMAASHEKKTTCGITHLGETYDKGGSSYAEWVLPTIDVSVGALVNRTHSLESLSCNILGNCPH